MTKILFVCHGNICRSPMAEFILKEKVRERGIESLFEIASAATSCEEIGNPVYPLAQKKLREARIYCGDKRARRITREDYDYYDLLIGMERYNLKNMYNFFGGDPECKIRMLVPGHDIDDPWYSGDFDLAFEEINWGCNQLLKEIRY